MHIREIFRYVRLAQAIQQSEVANAVGITHVALSRFEAGKSSLSIETLVKIAPLLNINPDFITGENINPFKSKKLIKLYGAGLMGKLYEPLNLLIEYNEKLDFVSLVPHFSGLKKLLSQTGTRILAPIYSGNASAALSLFVYAVAVRDSDDNYFLIRSQDDNGYLLWEGADKDVAHLAASMAQMLGLSERRSFTFKRVEINKPLYEKVKEWKGIRKEDMQSFFAEDNLILSEEERDLTNAIVRALRAGRISLNDLKKLLRRAPTSNKSF